MEEDEIAFEEGLMANIEGFTNDKDATEVYKLHPKLIPLLLSIVFMLVSFAVVCCVSFVFKWTFLSMSRNLNNSSYFSNQQKKHRYSSIYHVESSKSKKFYKNPLQTHKGMGPLTRQFLQRNVWQALIVLEVLCFYEFLMKLSIVTQFGINKLSGVVYFFV